MNHQIKELKDKMQSAFTSPMPPVQIVNGWIDTIETLITQAKQEELELTIKYLRDNYEGCIEENEYQKGFKHGLAMMIFQLEKSKRRRYEGD